MTHSHTLTLFILAIVIAATPSQAQIEPPRMARTPDIHGDKIVFSAEGDLWLGSMQSGSASRITTNEGAEINPHFSPDGRWIAFTGSYDGGQDVYVMPVEGGAPKRLTYGPTGASLIGWTPDSSQVLFRSRRENAVTGPRLYLVSIKGGLPKALPMERSAQGSFSADGKRLAFCRLPMEGHRWKRYHGGQANHIWIADLEARRYVRINKDDINEQYPVWVGNKLFYVSEKDGSANLWVYDVDSHHARRLTAHEGLDVRSPASDGKRIIYQWGNDLYLYDIASGKESRIKLTLASDRIHARQHTVAGVLNSFDLGPTGKRLVLEGRGQIFSAPAEKGEIRAIAAFPGSRSKEPVWSPDGKWIAFISDRSGEENLHVAPSSGTGEVRQLTDMKGLRLSGIVWSPDSRQLAIHTNSLKLFLIDRESRAITEVASSDYGDMDDYRFSPDGRWLAYSRQEERFVRSLYLRELAGGRTTRLTANPTRDSGVAFDPTGKYLYFVSERNVKPTGDGFDFQTNFMQTTRVYCLTLAAATPSPLPIENDEEPGSLTDSKPKPAAKPDEKEGSTHLPDVKVDLEGLGERILELPIPPGSYLSLTPLPGKLMYGFKDNASDPWKLKVFDFTTKKETELSGDIQAFAVSNDVKKMAVRTSSGLQVGDAGSVLASEGKVDLGGWQIPVDPEKEWHQIFLEAWRNQRDLLYDPLVHGQDWQVIRRRYEPLLAAVGARSELNEIIGEMQAEVNISHEFVGGGYQRRGGPSSPGFGLPGADLRWDPAAHSYRIEHLLRGDGFDMNARSPLLAPGANVHEGDYLLAINGTPLQADVDPYAQLIGQGNRIVAFQVNSKPVTEGAHTVHARTMSSESQARYYDWVARNRDYVAKHGGPNIGYIHIPDMEDRGMTEFTKHFYANLERDGLIIDVRYNGGGIVSGQILERLRRVIFEYDQSRYGIPTPYHFTAYNGRLTVICNEETASDGEYFCTGFKYMHLGPTCGTRTWGGFAAVNGFTMIDGGYVSTPVAGSFSPEGKWLPDGTGFQPDYIVEEDPNAGAEGSDPQLDKAIELLKEEIRKNPPHHIIRMLPPTKEKTFPPNHK